MEALPNHPTLDIAALSGCFRHVVNSYKFYWFLGILDHVEKTDDPVIQLDDLALGMLAQVWYPLDYFRLSFGAQDGFKLLAAQLSAEITIDNQLKAPPLVQQMELLLPPQRLIQIKQQIRAALMRWVGHRFLSPFFTTEIRGLRDAEVNRLIYQLSRQTPYTKRIPYTLYPQHIELDHSWRDYFKQHQTILRGFIHWHLVKFLQKHNPSVIGLTEKLHKPVERNLTAAKRFWRSFLIANETHCIYSNELLSPRSFSLDHFIPWSYVAHDQLWNIVPTFGSVNSAKGDRLPNLDYYLNRFCDLQYQAYHYHLHHGHYGLLDDYASLFHLTKFEAIEPAHFIALLQPEIAAHYRNAENLGFSASYLYKNIVI